MYIDEGSSGQKLLGGIGKSMDDFAGSAASGHFAVNESGGAALLAAIRDMAGWVDQQQGRLQVLAQQARLGSSNGAKVMQPHLQAVAADGQGFLTQLRAFSESLLKAEEGIKQAMANYQKTDSVNSSKLI